MTEFVAALALAFQASGVREITGSASYLARMALPPTAELTVFLDEFAAGKQTNLVSIKMVARGKQVPLGFSMPYRADYIQSGRKYGVRAEIRDGSRILFQTAQHTMVLSNGVRIVKLQLTPAASGDTFAFTDRTWKLFSLLGQSVASDEPPTLKFHAKDGRFEGFGGINRFSGTYEAEAGKAQIDPGPMTLMAGSEERMQLESRFVALLPTVNRIVVEEGELVLKRGSKELARFRK